jgi:hypothetical protein
MGAERVTTVSTSETLCTDSMQSTAQNRYTRQPTTKANLADPRHSPICHGLTTARTQPAPLADPIGCFRKLGMSSESGSQQTENAWVANALGCSV